MDPRDFKSLETEKLAEKKNYGFKFDPSLILLMFLIVCTLLLSSCERQHWTFYHDRARSASGGS